MASSVVVHHLENSRSQRVLWLLEELNVPYEMEMHRRHPKTLRAGADLKAIHPLGRAPIVVVDGVVLIESGAILETLLEQFDTEGSLSPDPHGEPHRRFRLFMHYAEGSLMPPLVVKLITSQLRGSNVPFFIRPIAGGIAAKIDSAYTNPEIDNHLTFLEGELSEQDYLCGDEFSAADIQMSFPLQAAASRSARKFADRPRLAAYLKRITSRPAYRAAEAKGGAVDLKSFASS